MFDNAEVEDIVNHETKVELTIGIPTHNGSKYMGQVLESILSQHISKEIEILISDNCSDDSTPNIIKEFEQRYPDLVSSYRNETNVGYDANVDLVVNRAKGRFVWILSDNDFLLPGSIEHVLSIIKEHPSFRLLFANYDSFPWWRNLELTEDTICPDGDVFFAKGDFKNSLVSSNIISKEAWCSLDMKKYIGCGWIHLAYSKESLAPCRNGKAIIVKDNLVRIVSSPTWGSRGRFIFYGFKFLDVFQNMAELGYDQETVKSAQRAIEGSYYKNIPMARLAGLKIDVELMKEFIRRFHRIPRFWIVDVPLLLMPNICYRIGYRAYCKILGRPAQILLETQEL